MQISIPPKLYLLVRNSFLGQIWKIVKGGAKKKRVKEEYIKYFQRKYGIPVFVETGTYLGDMVQAVKNDFKKIYSIELHETLFKNAEKKFSTLPHIRIIQGDSAKVLPELLGLISERCLFWLDAHYSGGITVRSDLETPIVKELKAIQNHPIKNHIILIDDAQAFTGENDYPEWNKLENLLKEINPNYKIEIKDNIVQVYP